jgi:hypothetical protein
MADSNLDNLNKFNWAVGYVFSVLLSNFPNPTPIPFNDKLPELFDDTGQYRRCLTNTVNWLVNENALQMCGVAGDPQKVHVTANPVPGVSANRFTLSAIALRALDVKVEALGATVKEAAMVDNMSGLAEVGHKIAYVLGGLIQGYHSS